MIVLNKGPNKAARIVKWYVMSFIENLACFRDVANFFSSYIYNMPGIYKLSFDQLGEFMQRWYLYFKDPKTRDKVLCDASILNIYWKDYGDTPMASCSQTLCYDRIPNIQNHYILYKSHPRTKQAREDILDIDPDAMIKYTEDPKIYTPKAIRHIQ